MEAQSTENDASRTVDIIPAAELDADNHSCVRKITWFRLPEFELSYNAIFSIRGSSQFHFYLWVLKDLSWAQSWYYSGNAFGILAVIWAGLLLFDSFREGNVNQMATGVGETLWLMANVWWMTGELHDNQFPSEEPFYDIRTLEAGYVMQAALVWMSAYYVIVKPLKLFGGDNQRTEEPNRPAPRLPKLFITWREYENVHVLFWMGKDCAWNLLNGPMWIAFLIPTFIVAADFVYLTFFSDRLLVDHAHNWTLLAWVIANLVWAAGEIYDAEYDEPWALYGLEGSDLEEAQMTCRWYAAWILVCSFFPLVVMYFLWIYYTASGQLKDRPYIVATPKPAKEEKGNIADHYVEKDGLELMAIPDENKKKEKRDIEVGDT